MVQSQEKLPHTSQHDTKVNQNCGNPKFLKIIKLTLVYQNNSKMAQYSENLVDQIDQNEL